MLTPCFIRIIWKQHLLGVQANKMPFFKKIYSKNVTMLPISRKGPDMIVKTQTQLILIVN